MRKRPLIEVRESSIHGKGVFALRRIRRGTRVVEYTGERISDDEGDRRYDDEKMQVHHTFLFRVKKNVLIDAAVDGSDARFINHSCDPNCEAVLDGKRIFIEAIRTIQPGEELSYDYSYEIDDAPEESWSTLYACQCGAANCRGTILDVKAMEKKKRKQEKKAKKAKKKQKKKKDGRKKGDRKKKDSKKRKKKKK